MLILSRRESEKVLFPTLGVSVEVLRIKGNVVKLGIDAPPEIPILRDEVARNRAIELTPDADNTASRLRDMSNIVRRRLDGASNALNQLHQRLDENGDEIAQQIVLKLYSELQGLEREANSALDWSSAAKSKQILVVEDSATERKLLASVLELNGLDVTTASDGQDALDYLSIHRQPDAILLDMMMPRCDGPSFVRQVRSMPELRNLRIFAVSSLEPGSLGLETGPNGIDGWFPKPLDPAELVSVLTARLNSPLAA